jgi:ClpP class serine protease
MDSLTSIGEYELDRIFTALNAQNPTHEKDVLLVILSAGGSIEPAYQISKICRTKSANKFSVAVPRFAKSAATLIAIGADEIHMGPLGHLGPIDPQLGGLPALGVSQALRSIASLAQEHPGSAEMLARYLHATLTIEQIGYCERISESAAQYAERLLMGKPSLATKAKSIAEELVHEYKHHGFVIDIEEAREHLGEDWIRTESPETAFAEDIYETFNSYNIFLRVYQSKRLLVIGGLSDVLVFDIPKQ